MIPNVSNYASWVGTSPWAGACFCPCTFCVRALTTLACVLRACLESPWRTRTPILWPLLAHDGRNRGGQRALDPCDPSLGHRTRRRLLSDWCVRRVAAPRCCQPFLGSSQRYGKVSRSVQVVFRRWKSIKLSLRTEKNLTLQVRLSCAPGGVLSLHVKTVTSWSYVVSLTLGFAIVDVAIIQHWAHNCWV